MPVLKPYDPNMFIRAGTGVAPARTLIYTNGPGPYPEDTFASWETLYAHYQTLEGPINIQFFPETGNLSIPAGDYQFKFGDSFSGAALNLPIQVNVDDGAIIRDMHVFQDNLLLIGNSTSTASLDYSLMAAEFNFTVLVFFGGSGLNNQGTVPMIQWDKDISVSGPLLINMALAAQFATGVTPAVDITPGGAYASVLIVQMFLGTNISPDVISGSGFAIAQVWISDPGVIFSTDQPSWAGLSNLSSPSVFQSRVNTYTRFSVTDTFVVSGSYSAGEYPTIGVPGSEYVRCRPDGSLTPIDINLPSVALYPGASFTVKRDNPDIATTITVNAFGGDLIDGSATDVVPATAYSYRTYISDGAHWMREGTGI